ncbi:hypothetical protein [Streptomyces sp. NPDC093261]|uniref:hypothetical protein n=1 Tax=Streptomyces sp. NPDC093261 TaxID=3366037 RepID=UPI0037F68CFA
MILAVLDRDRPVAALALVRETARDGSTRITPLAWAASEQVRPVGESGEAVGSLIRHLPHLADRVLIAELPHGSPLDRQAEDTWGRRDIQTLYATIPLPVDLAALSRSTRRDHVRRRRDVQALGDRIGYRRTRTRAELLSAYDALEALYRRRNASLGWRVGAHRRNEPPMGLPMAHCSAELGLLEHGRAAEFPRLPDSGVGCTRDPVMVPAGTRPRHRFE